MFNRENRRVPLAAPPQDVIDLAPEPIRAVFAEHARLFDALSEAMVEFDRTEREAERAKETSVATMATAYRSGTAVLDDDGPEQARDRVARARRRVEAAELAVDRVRDDIIFALREHGPAWIEAANDRAAGALSAARASLAELEDNLADVTLGMDVNGFVKRIERKPVFVQQRMESPRYDYQHQLIEVRSADTAIAVLADLIREAGDVYDPPAPAKSSGSAVVETPYGAVIWHGGMPTSREVEEVVEANDAVADDAPIEIVD